MCDEFITESVLGDKEYWEHFYEEELANFDDNGDTGETWFGKRNTHNIINWIELNIPRNGLFVTLILEIIDIFHLASICDIGCGNGYILASLAKKGFETLLGIDYSEKAIEFCNKLYSIQESKIKFCVMDILQSNCLLEEKMQVFIDKGTYDAICLMPNSNLAANRQSYLSFIKSNLESNTGHFVLMSCNFTKEELMRSLLGDEFEIEHEFEAPRLAFGGQIGQQVTGLVLRKSSK